MTKQNFILEPYRQTLHKQLLLDLSMPRFRRANRYLFESETPSNGPLLNPHEAVKMTDNGKIYMLLHLSINIIETIDVDIFNLLLSSHLFTKIKFYLLDNIEFI